jgi:acyl-CoA thioesterase
MSQETMPATQDGVRRAQAAVQLLYLADRASHWLGIEILDVAPGRAQIAMTVRPDMINGHGVCHGGVIFMFADSAFAFACNSHGDPMVAAGAHIEFLAPMPAGERVLATAAEVSRGPRHGIYDVTVTGSAQQVFAHFRGRCSRLRVSAQSV